MTDAVLAAHSHTQLHVPRDLAWHLTMLTHTHCTSSTHVMARRRKHVRRVYSARLRDWQLGYEH